MPTGRRLIFAVSIFFCLAMAGLPFLSSGSASSDVSSVPAKPTRRPDIVLVTIDALRPDRLSLYGHARLTSPAIDRLATRSAVFTNAITQAPYTKAAVASLMSGLSPSAHRTVTATVPLTQTLTGRLASEPLSTDVLSPDLTTLAEGLRAAGYRTLGFTANPFLIAPFGFAQGFDTFTFLPGGDFATADRLVDEALHSVQGAGRQPLFLWVHLMEPHSPYVPPRWAAGMFPVAGAPQPIPAALEIPPWLLPGTPRDLRPYETGYDEEIVAADTAVDVLLRGFGELRDAGNTVTVLTSDHGEQFLDHGGFEHSDTLYDELIRIPLVIQAPHVRAARVDTQVQLLDLYPTILGFGGADPVPGAEGRDLRDVLSGSDASLPAYAECYGALSAIRVDGWKLIRWADGRTALFDLQRDPREQHDLSASEHDRVERLDAMLSRHDTATAARGRSMPTHTSIVDPEALERLRALGYTGK